MYSPEVNQPSPVADPASPAAARSPGPDGGAVERTGGGETEGASSSTDSPSCSDAVPASSKSKIPNPKSDLHSFPNESALISAIAAGTDDPEVLAERHGIDLPLFLDWLRAPATTERINILLSARHIARENKIRARLDRAMDTLEELHIKADENSDPVERRRSAATVARFSSGSWRNSAPRLSASAGTAPASSTRNPDAAGLSLSRFPSHFRTRSRTIRTVPILHESPVILPDAHIDDLDESASPSEATIELLHRLQNSDNPRAGDGLRCLFHRFTPEMKSFVEARTADEFACTHYEAYHSLIAHHSAVLHPTQFPEPSPSDDEYPSDPPSAPTRAVQTVDLIDLDGDRITAEFCFTRDSLSAPWLINELNISVKPDTDPDPDTPANSTGPP